MAIFTAVPTLALRLSAVRLFLGLLFARAASALAGRTSLAILPVAHPSIRVEHPGGLRRPSAVPGRLRAADHRRTSPVTEAPHPHEPARRVPG